MASFQEILNSKIFKFVVGEAVDGKPSEFPVHEEAIAQLSTPLRTLINSSNGRATWGNVSKETFERFVQYAYNGDYSIPETEKRSLVVVPKVNGIHPKLDDSVAKSDTTNNGVSTHPSSPVVANGTRGRDNSLESEATRTSEGPNECQSENQPLPHKKHKKKKAKATLEKTQKETDLREKNGGVQEPEQQTEPQPEEPKSEEPLPEETEPVESDQVQTQTESTELAPKEESPVQYVLTADFQSLSFPLLAPRNKYEGTCEPSTEFAKDHNYANVFLCHASLYVLGDDHQVASLKALALFKLHKTLCTFELDEENIEDITDLARYAYSGQDKVSNEGIGGLRNLVCQYLAIHAKELSVNAGFMKLLAGGGQIIIDFFQFQLQRIH